MSNYWWQFIVKPIQLLTAVWLAISIMNGFITWHNIFRPLLNHVNLQIMRWLTFLPLPAQHIFLYYQEYIQSYVGEIVPMWTFYTATVLSPGATRQTGTTPKLPHNMVTVLKHITIIDLIELFCFNNRIKACFDVWSGRIRRPVMGYSGVLCELLCSWR